jgi:hypothetical protein
LRTRRVGSVTFRVVRIGTLVNYWNWDNYDGKKYEWKIEVKEDENSDWVYVPEPEPIIEPEPVVEPEPEPVVEPEPEPVVEPEPVQVNKTASSNSTDQSNQTDSKSNVADSSPDNNSTSN